MSSANFSNFSSSPYQTVEYLIGRENGTTKVGLVSSVAGFHGTWVHPNPGQPLKLNVLCVGAGGAGGGGYRTSGTATSGTNGTRTIFGVITAFAGDGGGPSAVGGTGLPGNGLIRSIDTQSRDGQGISLGMFANAGNGGSGGTGANHGNVGGTGYFALSSALTVTGNVDYIVGKGGIGGTKSSGNIDAPETSTGGDGGDGVVIVQYNSVD